MKLVYDDGEIDLITKIYNERKDTFTMFDESNPERVYSLSFKVTNHALAQYALASLLNKWDEEMNLGINVTSINYGDLANKNEVKARLHGMIEEILG